MDSILWLDTLAILLGYILDMLFGDPAGRFHPVCIIGRLISALDKLLYREHDSDRVKLVKGGILTAAVIAVTAAVTAGILYIPWSITSGMVSAGEAVSHTGMYRTAAGNFTTGRLLYLALASVLCDCVLAARDLKKESMAVYYALRPGAPEKAKNAVTGAETYSESMDPGPARKALSRIVGRDTERLDEKGVIRAAVETIAENTSDGEIAPLFYLCIGGPVLAMVYKAVNTMDSMIGYKNDRYLFFGRAAARLDDIANYIPSRISAFLWIAAAWICREDVNGAFRIWKRDRRNHESPNSAQTESACAGSLGVRLAGDAYYFGKKKEKPYIGDPIREIEADDIPGANRMMMTASFLALILGAAARGVLLLIS